MHVQILVTDPSLCDLSNVTDFTFPSTTWMLASIIQMCVCAAVGLFVNQLENLQTACFTGLACKKPKAAYSTCNMKNVRMRVMKRKFSNLAGARLNSDKRLPRTKGATQAETRLVI